MIFIIQTNSGFDSNSSVFHTEIINNNNGGKEED